MKSCSRKITLVALGLLSGPASVWAASPAPLPPTRPHELELPSPTANGSPSPPHPAPPAEPVATAAETAECDDVLASGKIRAERLPPVSGDNGCGVPVPVKLTAIALAGGRTIQLEPPVTIRCVLAGTLADWIRDDLAPLLATHHGGLAKLSGMGGYECRGRNRVAGAKLSEHGTGDAVDIGAFVLADGTAAKIADVATDDMLFAQVKLTTCARFSTVLGPGSDGYHEDNLHLDLEPRRNGKHFCRWQLP